MDKPHLLLLSLDCLSQEDLAQLVQMPHFSRLLGEGTLVRDVDSVFLTNTYVIHTSIITGKGPRDHGIFDNLENHPGNPNPPWHWHRSHIRGTTLYDEAERAGLKTANILWPVTAGARITWNFPEIFPVAKENQLLLSLRNGGPLFQLGGYLRFGKGLRGKHQPELDNFTTRFMIHTLHAKRPNLSLLHLIDTDSHKHKHGLEDERTRESIARMDRRIGALTRAMEQLDKEYSIIIFSDHGALPVSVTGDPNDILEAMDFQVPRKPGDPWNAWFKTCGGTAFLYLKDDAMARRQELTERLEAMAGREGSGIRRLLTAEEMDSSGFSTEAVLGLEASIGTEFHDDGTSFQANHGYTLDNPGYKVFYFAKGPGVPKGQELSGGSLLDIAPLAARLLNIPPWDIQGRIHPKLSVEE